MNSRKLQIAEIESQLELINKQIHNRLNRVMSSDELKIRFFIEFLIDLQHNIIIFLLWDDPLTPFTFQ